MNVKFKNFWVKIFNNSEQLYQAFSQGLLANEGDFIIWSSLYEMLCQNEIPLQKLI
jgi:hypothetical protein